MTNKVNQHSDYAFAVVDLSYILQRNLFACSRGKKIGEFTAGDVVKMTIQTLNKIPRDYKINISKYTNIINFNFNFKIFFSDLTKYKDIKRVYLSGIVFNAERRNSV